jgi:hypothetical protein
MTLPNSDNFLRIYGSGKVVCMEHTTDCHTGKVCFDEVETLGEKGLVLM